MTMAVNAIRDFTGTGESGSARLRISPQELARAAEAAAAEDQGPRSFSQTMQEFAGDVNDLQFQAGDAINKFVTGEAADVHQVMVAVRQAGIAMDLMLEIRNRALEGYQELIRMTV